MLIILPFFSIGQIKQVTIVFFPYFLHTLLIPCSLKGSSENAGFSRILASFSLQDKNGKAWMKISKGNMYSSKATVVYTLQIGMARELFMVYTT